MANGIAELLLMQEAAGGTMPGMGFGQAPSMASPMSLPMSPPMASPVAPLMAPPTPAPQFATGGVARFATGGQNPAGSTIMSGNKPYSTTALLNLAQQIVPNLGELSGGIFGTKGETVGFSYDTVKNLLGRDPTTTDQVVLDMAKHLMDKGVTDINQLSIKDIKGSPDVVPIYDDVGNTLGYHYWVDTGDDQGYWYRLSPEDAAKVVTTTTDNMGDPVVKRTINDIVTGKGLYSGENLLLQTRSPQEELGYGFGETYSGPGMTGYKIVADPKTGKPRFTTYGSDTGDKGLIKAALALGSLAFGGPLLSQYLGAGAGAGAIPGIEGFAAAADMVGGAGAGAAGAGAGAAGSFIPGIEGFAAAADMVGGAGAAGTGAGSFIPGIEGFANVADMVGQGASGIPGIEGFSAAADAVGGANYIPGIEGFAEAADMVGQGSSGIPGIEGFAEAADAVGGGTDYIPGIEGFAEAADEVGGAGAGSGGFKLPSGISNIADLFKSIGDFAGQNKNALLVAGLLPLIYNALKDKKTLSTKAPYSGGALSKFKYDPSKFTPSKAVPNVYQPKYTTYASGGITNLAIGGGLNNVPTGPVERMSQNVVGAGGMYPQSQIDRTYFATPTQMPASAEVINADYDAPTNPYTGAMMAAGGSTDMKAVDEYASEAGKNTSGLAKTSAAALKDDANALAALARLQQLRMLKAQHNKALKTKGADEIDLASGGPALREGAFVIPADVVSHLGNGSTDAGIATLARRTGAKPIRGNGDGMSDSIPTTIGGRQPARVADGEAIIEPEQVRRIGRGSSKQGAKKLYAMMDKVRKARTGTAKQGRQINPHKYLPS